MKRAEGRVPVVIGLVVLAFVLPVIYVFSVGPSVWLTIHGYIPVEWHNAFYLPIRWLSDNFEAVRRPLAWYLEFWT